MLQQTRDNLNDLIHNIKAYDLIRERLLKSDKDWFYLDFEKQYNQAIDDWETAISYFERETAKIFERNLDKGIQTSVNYYRRKAGFKPFKITAIM